MKENILQDFCFQELQDGTGIDYDCSSWKLLPVKVGLSPFLAWAWLAKAKGHSCHTKNSTLAKTFTEKNE